MERLDDWNELSPLVKLGKTDCLSNRQTWFLLRKLDTQQVSPMCALPDSPGMPIAPNHHHRQHQHRVKYIHGPFIGQQISLWPRCVLNYPEERPDHDKYTHRIQRIKMVPPIHLIARWFPSHSPLKDNRGYHEEAKYNNLNHQPANGNALCCIFLSCCRHHARTTTLHQERDNVTGQKDLCHPVNSNQGVFLRTNTPDEAAEKHVYRCGKEHWCKEDEYALDDVRPEFASLVGASCAGPVADYLNCKTSVDVHGKRLRRADEHRPPTQKGIQNRDFVVQVFQQWNAVAPRKRKKKMIDAGMEGTYSQR